MLALFNIVQGTISTIMGSAGFSTPQQTVLPPELITSVEECGFFESIPLWAVTLIGGLFITVMSFILIMTVYGRFLSSICIRHLHPFRFPPSPVNRVRMWASPSSKLLCCLLGGRSHCVVLHHLLPVCILAARGQSRCSGGHAGVELCGRAAL